MKIIFAPDSFKGSLSSKRVCELLEQEAKKVFPDCCTVSIPISDGGEGALDVVLSALEGRKISVPVQNPLGNRILAEYGIFHKDCAFIEMAAASGLTLLEPEDRKIMQSNTYGTGELILDALEMGCRNFYIAIGGSATNDGGIGCAAALGVRFLGQNGETLSPIPQNMDKIARIDLDGLHPGLKRVDFTVLCDVQNPLTGTDGATFIFGPQKGAGPKELAALEEGMENYRRVLKETFGRDIGAEPGAGAAGGLGAGLMAFTRATLCSGIQAILELVGFKFQLSDADLVVTGEGRIDHQSAFGKVPSGVGSLCQEYGVPCVTIAGSIGEGAEQLKEYGISGMMSILSAPMSLELAIQNAEPLFRDAAKRMFELLRTGQELKNAK